MPIPLPGFGLVCGACQAFNDREASACDCCGARLRLGETATPAARAERAPAAAAAPQPVAGSQCCPQCGASIPADYRFCGTCGAVLEGGGGAPAEPESRGITELAGSGAGGRTEALYGMASEGPPKARLVVVHGEGVDGMSYTLGARDHVAGRSQGQVLFPDDEFLSPRHAIFHWREGTLTVRDDGSVNGVYHRILAPTRLNDGEHMLVGEQFLRFELTRAPEEIPDGEGTYFMGSRAPEGPFRLVQILPGNRPGLVYGARNPVVEMGREGCDLNFPHDRFMSRRHAKVESAAAGFNLADLGSRNGTFIRIHDELELRAGDHIFLGQQLLRVELTAQR